MILADKIITLRKKNGWSQEELAEQLGVSRQAVSKWEGAQSIPDLERVLRMAQLFGVITDFLLKDEMEESEPAAAAPNDAYADSPVRTVSMEEASAFLKAKEQTTGRIALGTFLCTFAPVPLLLLTGISTFTELSLSSEAACLLGLVLLFAAVACALLLFFSCRRYTEPFDYLETELIDTAYGVSGMVRQQKQQNGAAHARLAVGGTLAGPLSPLPLLVTALLEMPPMMTVAGLCVTILMGGLCAVLFILLQVWLELEMPDYMTEVTELLTSPGGSVTEILKSGGMMLLCALGSLASSVSVSIISSVIISGKFSR
jgi:transcriptional regulator with XRE-family HTH domain